MKMNILVVEDDEVDIESIRRAFQKSKMPVNLIIAKNGVEALDKLYARNGEKGILPLPKLIILDLNLPKMTGIEFLKVLRSDPQFGEMNILILTTSKSFEDKSITFNMNIAGYIVKPFNIEEFISHCKILA